MIELLNREIERSGDTYVEARNRLFGKESENLEPAKATLDVVADHPTLQRVLPPVRRFLQGVIRERGLPERIAIEHVRNAFLGFEAKEAAISEQRRNQRDRERVAEHIKDAYGLASPTPHQIRRLQAYERQNGQCLYCGDGIPEALTELDHIVARAVGGNSTQANLAAVCRDCNQAKGKDTFALFAASGRRPGVTLEGALQRVDSMARGDVDNRRVFRLKKEMKARLKQTELDEPIDERALASTAYAAVDMRDRIMGTYGLGYGEVPVYPGRITQAARAASGIDGKLDLRPGVLCDRCKSEGRNSCAHKSRLDRRHHAIDALIAAMLNPSVARTLAERSELRRESQDKTDGTDTAWKNYDGSCDKAKAKYRKWRDDMGKLAYLVRAEIEAGRVTVVSPLRFAPSHAALHKAGRSPHTTLPLGGEWSSADRARMVDDRVYAALSKGLQPSLALGADPHRTLTLPSGIVLGPQDPIFVFPDTKSRIVLPGRSSSPLGSSLHHIRVYRWDDDKGRRQAGVVRVFASDLYDVEGGINGDVLNAPLPETSRAVRRAHPKLRDAMWAGRVEHVGTVVPGDEVLIEPAEWITDSTKLGRFLQRWPERHWRLSGWEMDRQFNLKTMVLSLEGVQLEAAGDERRVVVSSEDHAILEDGAPSSATYFWSTPSTRVVRRTALGRERNDAESGLPSSWSPYEAVYGP